MKNQTIILRMTNSCNLNCTYCYDKSNDIGDNENFKKNMEQTIKNICSLNIDQNHIQKIILHGGEPLIVPITVYEAFLEKLSSKIPKLQLSIQTNATLITKEHINLFKKYNIHVGISLDGCNEDQNSCRIYKNGSNSFNKVMESIELLKDANIKFGVIITISKKHIGQEEELYNFIKKNNINCSIRPAFPIKNSTNQFILSPKEYFVFFKNFFDLWYNDESSNIKLNQIIDLYDELFKILEPGYRVNCCSDCKSCFGKFISLDTKGNLYSCNRTYGIPDFFYGNMKNISIANLQEIITSFNKKRIDYLENSKCKACSIYKYCYGGCPASSYNIHNTYLAADDTFCDAKIKITNYILDKLTENGDLKYYQQHKKIPERYK